MTNVIIGLSRYVLSFFFALYSFHCFLSFGSLGKEESRGVGIMQAFFLLAIHTGGFLVLYFKIQDSEALYYWAQSAIFKLFFFWSRKFHEHASLATRYLPNILFEERTRCHLKSGLNY